MVYSLQDSRLGAINMYFKILSKRGITMWDKVIGAVVVAVATEIAKEIINENK